MIRNVILDWSGTLVDDLPAVLQATNHVLERAGRPPLTLEVFRREFRLPFRGFYEQFTPHVAMEQLETWFHGHFRTVQDLVEALPHARAFLEFCRGRGLRTFLLSTVHEEHFRVQAGRTGLGAFLERPYLGVWDKRVKIREILVENGLDPRETLFVGDMEHDIETARHGGMHACAVLTGYNNLEQLRRSGPDLIVEHLGELRGHLERSGLEFPPPAPDRDGRGGRGADGSGPVVTVGGLIYNGEDEVLMIRTHKWSDRWGIPGGKVKRGETCEAALARELREETGLAVGDIRFVLVQDCIDSEEFYRPAHFVLLNYTCRVAGRPEVRLNEEARDHRWVALEAAFALELNRPTRVLLEAVRPKADTH